MNSGTGLTRFLLRHNNVYSASGSINEAPPHAQNQKSAFVPNRKLYWWAIALSTAIRRRPIRLIRSSRIVALISTLLILRKSLETFR